MTRELISQLKPQITLVNQYFESNTCNPNYGGVWFPLALQEKYPKETRQLGWHYLFRSFRLSKDPQSLQLRRHHIGETTLTKVIKKLEQPQTSTKTSLAMDLGIVLLLIYCKEEQTLEPYENNWAIQAFERRKYTFRLLKEVPKA